MTTTTATATTEREHQPGRVPSRAQHLRPERRRAVESSEQADR